MNHWAFDLIGLPYEETEEGNCWGFVRRCFREHCGITMPVINVSESMPDNAFNRQAIRKVVEASGWYPTSASEPKDMDIALMWGAVGRHVGIIVKANSTMNLLHCERGQGVILTQLRDLNLLGFHSLTYWRKK